MSRPRLRTLLRQGAIYTAIITAVTLLTAGTYPGGSETLYEDLRDYDESLQRAKAAEKANVELDSTIARITERLALKDLWLEELIAGRATLRETAHRFMEIQRGSGADLLARPDAVEGDSPEEKVARIVVSDVAGLLKVAPAPSDALRRIQNEFQLVYGKTISVK